MQDSESTLIDEAVAMIGSRVGGLPAAAVVLGSGQGKLREELEIDWSLPYDELPGGRASTAMGHAGRLTCGRLDGRPLLVLEGRIHLYEGATCAETVRLVRILHRLGVHQLMLTNAAGGLHPDYQVGDLVVIDECLDFTFRRGCLACGDQSEVVWGSGAPVFDRELSDAALAAARRQNVIAHRGVYAQVIGPNYETRAEWRAYRRIGADVIGMSTAGEARTAAQLGLRVLGLSTVTNCCRPDAPESTHGAEVVAAAQRAVDGVRVILASLLAAEARHPQ